MRVLQWDLLLFNPTVIVYIHWKINLPDKLIAICVQISMHIPLNHVDVLRFMQVPQLSSSGKLIYNIVHSWKLFPETKGLM
jgi:hypothetical protein